MLNARPPAVASPKPVSLNMAVSMKGCASAEVANAGRMNKRRIITTKLTYSLPLPVPSV